MKTGILKKYALRSPHIVLRTLRQPKIYVENKNLHESAIQMLVDLTQAGEVDVRKYYKELKEDRKLLESATLRSNFIGVKKVPVQAVALYILVRIEEPDVFVETGVNTGYSTAFILRALERNGSGKLYSIDLPGTEDDPVEDPNAPGDEEVVYNLSDETKVGFRVMESTKEFWDLRLGDSKDLLPELVEELDQIDIFFHDSLHSYDHMMFEFETVLSVVKKGGIIGSDDIDWNNAFEDFVAKENLSSSKLYDLEKNNGYVPDCIGFARIN